MQFHGVGVIPFEAPCETLRSFMINKYKKWFRSFDSYHEGKIDKKNLLENLGQVSVGFTEEEKEKERKNQLDHWNFVVLFGNESITEEEAINVWMNERVFVDPQTRRKYMEESMKYSEMFFRQMDLDGNGYVDYEEWISSPRGVSLEKLKVLFNTIDANKDGMISLEEWQYAIIYYHFCSGPDSPYSLLFGPIHEDKG